MRGTLVRRCPPPGHAKHSMPRDTHVPRLRDALVLRRVRRLVILRHRDGLPVPAHHTPGVACAMEQGTYGSRLMTALERAPVSYEQLHGQPCELQPRKPLQTKAPAHHDLHMRRKHRQPTRVTSVAARAFGLVHACVGDVQGAAHDQRRDRRAARSRALPRLRSAAGLPARSIMS